MVRPSLSGEDGFNESDVSVSTYNDLFTRGTRVLPGHPGTSTRHRGDSRS